MVVLVGIIILMSAQLIFYNTTGVSKKVDFDEMMKTNVDAYLMTSTFIFLTC